MQIQFHLESFYTKFVPELQPLLEAVAKGETEISIRCERASFSGLRCTGDTSAELASPLRHSSGQESKLVLSIGRDSQALSEHFQVYVMPLSIARAGTVGRYRQSWP